MRMHEEILIILFSLLLLHFTILPLDGAPTSREQTVKHTAYILNRTILIKKLHTIIIHDGIILKVHGC
jgi:hypothetical protein